MASKLINRVVNKACTQIEETMIPKFFKKAGIPISEENANNARWFIGFGSGSRGKQVEKDQNWRNSLVSDVLPLLDYERGDEAAKKAEAISGGRKYVDKSLKRLGLAARLEKWAGGTMATAAFLLNPMSVARMLGQIVVGSGYSVLKSEDNTSLLLMAIGTVVFGLAAWARSKISKARADFNYLSESALFLANELLPADAKARNLAIEARTLLDEFEGERKKSDSAHKLFISHANAATKIYFLGLGDVTEQLSSNQCEIAFGHLEAAKSFESKILDKHLPLIARVREATENQKNSMSERGIADLQDASHSLLAISKAMFQDSMQREYAESSALVIYGQSVPKSKDGLRLPPEIISAIGGLAELLAGNELARRELEAMKCGGISNIVPYANKSAAIGISEDYAKRVVRMIMENASIGMPNGQIMEFLADYLNTCNGQYAEAVSSGAPDALYAAATADVSFLTGYSQVVRDVAKSN
ncbi:MAG: hypothetical protein WCT52_03585 [Candidatus Micrarchaeia archaeon]